MDKYEDMIGLASDSLLRLSLAHIRASELMAEGAGSPATVSHLFNAITALQAAIQTAREYDSTHRA